MTIAVVTGGRDRTPTLLELEHLAEALTHWRVTTVRHGNCRGTDKLVGSWVKARGLANVESWPAESYGPWPGCGPKRNRAMLDGDDLFGAATARPRADLLVAFPGGRGTSDCTDAALERGLPVVSVDATAEPRIWNRHHGDPPGAWIYIGRGSPLGNPFQVELQEGESRADAVGRALEKYRAWLWSRIRPGPDRSPIVVDALRHLTPEHYIVCSCWPANCHGEVVVRAWRWMGGRS